MDQYIFYADRLVSVEFSYITDDFVKINWGLSPIVQSIILQNRRNT